MFRNCRRQTATEIDKQSHDFLKKEKTERKWEEKMSQRKLGRNEWTAVEIKKKSVRDLI